MIAFEPGQLGQRADAAGCPREADLEQREVMQAARGRSKLLAGQQQRQEKRFLCAAA